MERIRNKVKILLRKVFCLPPVPALLISIPAYGLVIYALTGEHVNPVLVYASYLLSSYALMITITGIAGVVSLVWKVLGIPLVGRYLREDMKILGGK